MQFAERSLANCYIAACSEAREASYKLLSASLRLRIQLAGAREAP